jgi:hypothetical protein
MTPLAVVPREACRRELDLCVAKLRAEYSDPAIEASIFDDVQANDVLLYAHYPQIGSIGLFVERRTGRVWHLGSSNPLDACLWAYEVGFRFDETNTVVLTSIAEHDRTMRCLKGAFTGRAVHQMKSQLASPPVALELSWDQCWFWFRELHQIALAGEPFTFEVNPRP